jgi:hypothetical protein
MEEELIESAFSSPQYAKDENGSVIFEHSTALATPTR